LAYYLFARFSDMALLTQADFSFELEPQPHLVVRLTGGKTDSKNLGFQRYVAANEEHSQYCPVRLTRQFFELLGAQHTGFLVCRTQTGSGGSLRFDGSHSLSYTTALQDFRFLLHKLGYHPDHFSEHSAKRGAVTDSAAAGLDSSSMKKVVGWSSSSMPDLYTDWPLQHYLSCSAKLHLKN